jgi:hypothetical protein
MKAGLKRLWPYIAGLIIVLIVTGRLGDYLYHRSRISGPPAGRTYSGFAAAMSLLAFSAAVIAVTLTLPSFISWARTQFQRPRMKLFFEVAETSRTIPRLVPKDSTHGVPQTTINGTGFIVHVNARNDGNAPLRNALINIHVPVECELQVADVPIRQHYLAVLPTDMSEEDQEAGDPEYMAFSVGYDTMAANTDNYFHVRVKVPTFGTYRVVAYLFGDPPLDKSGSIGRIDVVATAPSLSAEQS